MRHIYFLFVLVILSCHDNPGRIQTGKTIDSINSNPNEKLADNWVDSIYITDFWVKTYLPEMDSISFSQIEKYRKDNYYPFFKLNTNSAKNYIKDYSESDSYGVYVISKQYSSDNYISLILFHWGDCIWNFYLVTISKFDSEYIDSERILYLADNCAPKDIKQQMTTYFSKNKFEIFDILDYWTSEDNEIEDPALMDIHVIDSSLTKCEIYPNGTINREKKNSKINVP